MFDSVLTIKSSIAIAILAAVAVASSVTTIYVTRNNTEQPKIIYRDICKQSSQPVFLPGSSIKRHHAKLTKGGW